MFTLPFFSLYASSRPTGRADSGLYTCEFVASNPYEASYQIKVSEVTTQAAGLLDASGRVLVLLSLSLPNRNSRSRSPILRSLTGQDK